MAFSAKKRGAQLFAASRNCLNASSFCLEKCQVSELLWACISWDLALSREAMIFGGRVGFFNV